MHIRRPVRCTGTLPSIAEAACTGPATGATQNHEAMTARRRGGSIRPPPDGGQIPAGHRVHPAAPDQALRRHHAGSTRGPGRAAQASLKRASMADRSATILVNLLGAAGAALFARASRQYYWHTHRLIGAAFFIEQIWFVAAFLIRRTPGAVSRHPGSWLLAAGGTFGGVLFRPAGAHPGWGVATGLGLQVPGLAIAIVSLLALGRSFGFVAADRGLVTRGPYAVVRHPVYAAYMVIQSGYLLQAISPRNIAVLVLATGCNAGRAIAEERVLAASSAAYEAYRRRVRWRLLPGLW